MAAEPEAMIAKAATHLTTVGAEKAYSGFTTSVECGLKDLRTLVNDMGSGLRMAHGANATLVGKVVRELKDRDGKFPNQVIEEVAKAKAKISNHLCGFKYRRSVFIRIKIGGCKIKDINRFV